MAKLERAVAHADQRIVIRKNVIGRAQVSLMLLGGFPLSAYLLYNWFAPGGVMQNMKASSGAYMYWPQNFMYRPKTQREMYRPEYDNKEMYTPLSAYSRRVAAQREAGTLPENVFNPTSWH
jgi:hypothetical protein